MTVWTLVACIIALLTLLLLAPIRLRLSLQEGDLRVGVQYLLFFLSLSPEAMAKREARAERKQVRKKPKPADPEKKQPAKAAKPASKRKMRIQDLRAGIRASKEAADLLRRHVVFYRVKIDLSVSRSDAHQTALAYGRVSALIAVLLSLIDSIFVLHKPEVRILPDFTKEKTTSNIALRVRIRPLFLFLAAGKAGVSLLRRPSSPAGASTKKKGGRVHESAASN